MCGIFGYANFLTRRTKKEISNILVDGLRRIEYRGYDSAGCAIQHNNKFVLFKEVGKVEKLAELIDQQNLINAEETLSNHVGIAHTRWATHGEPAKNNTHPLRSDLDGKFMCVHNGIITNYKDLKEYLQSKDFVFESETDTECAAKLALHFYKVMKNKKEKLDFVEIVKKVAQNCDGAFAFVFVSTLFPNEIVAVRKSSPLLIGIKTNSPLQMDFLNVNFGTSKDDNVQSVLHEKIGPMDSLEDLRSIEPLNESDTNQIELFLASDASAIIEHTKKVIFLEDEDIAHIKNGKLMIHRPNSVETDLVKKNTREVHTIETELNQIMKGNFEHFMLKEIFEQPESVVNTMRGRVNFETNEVFLGGIQEYIRSIKKSSRLIFIACGTSYHSCLANRTLFEELVDIPVQVEISSDFLDRRALITRSDTCFFISQSGETADTILALKYCQAKGALCVGITNTVGSTISRETLCGVHINAGPEIGVASTKAYTSQYVALVLIALMMAQDNISSQKRRSEIMQGLNKLPKLLKNSLKLAKKIESIASDLKDEKSLMILGRGYQHATCLEAALKIKELTYIPTEGILSGELKHGPIALIDESVQVIFIISNDRDLDKAQNAVQQIKARKGKLLIICTKELESKFEGMECVSVLKTVDCLQGLVSVLPMQLLAYHVANAKGYDVDCPRNLAKSVTVE